MLRSSLLLLCSCGSLALEPGVGYMTTTGERRQDIPDFVYFELTLVEKPEPIRYPTSLWEPPEQHWPAPTEEAKTDVTVNIPIEAAKLLLGPTTIGAFYLWHRHRNPKPESE